MIASSHLQLEGACQGQWQDPLFLLLLEAPAGEGPTPEKGGKLDARP